MPFTQKIYPMPQSLTEVRTKGESQRTPLALKSRVTSPQSFAGDLTSEVSVNMGIPTLFRIFVRLIGKSSMAMAMRSAWDARHSFPSVPACPCGLWSCPTILASFARESGTFVISFKFCTRPSRFMSCGVPLTRIRDMPRGTEDLKWSNN